MRFMIASSVILLTLSGCGIGSAETKPEVTIPAPQPGNFCLIYKPVYTSKLDTEETKKQVDKNNAVWMEQCEKNAS